MRIPKRPPDIDEILSEIAKTPDGLRKAFRTDVDSPIKGKYLHWDKLLYHNPPTDFSHEEWWLSLKLSVSDCTRRFL